MTTDRRPRWSAAGAARSRMLGEDAFRGYSPPTADQWCLESGDRAGAGRGAAHGSADRPAHSLHVIRARRRSENADRLHRRARSRRKSFTTGAARPNSEAVRFSPGGVVPESSSRDFEACVRAAEVPGPETLATTSALSERLKSFCRARAGRWRKTRRWTFASSIWRDARRRASGQDAPEYLVSHRRPDAATTRHKRACLSFRHDPAEHGAGAHGRSIFDHTLQVAASITRCVHRPFRADEWLPTRKTAQRLGGRALTRANCSRGTGA